MAEDDWEEGPGVKGAPVAVAGTITFSALSVLHGGPHTVCSMLEGLYLSVLDISSEGRSTKAPPPSVRKARMQRSSQLGPQLEYEHDIAEHVKPMVLGLQNLFFQPTSGIIRQYNERVTAADVHAICKYFVPNIMVE